MLILAERSRFLFPKEIKNISKEQSSKYWSLCRRKIPLAVVRAQDLKTTQICTHVTNKNIKRQI
jgi:hypothetical protein